MKIINELLFKTDKPGILSILKNEWEGGVKERLKEKMGTNPA